MTPTPLATADGLSVAEVLERAADLIIENGWAQKVWYSDGGCMCAEGAIYKAGTSRAADEAMAFLEMLLPHPRASNLRVVPAWNDAPGRTQAEVVAKLREAAALAKAQQA